jgi:hypothetical protein
MKDPVKLLVKGLTALISNIHETYQLIIGLMLIGLVISVTFPQMLPTFNVFKFLTSLISIIDVLFGAFLLLKMRPIVIIFYSIIPHLLLGQILVSIGVLEVWAVYIILIFGIVGLFRQPLLSNIIEYVFPGER